MALTQANGTPIKMPTMSELGKMWSEAVAIESSFVSIPDGDYLCALKEMAFGQATSGSKRWQVVTTFEVVEGEQEGQTCKRFDGVIDTQGMGHFKHVCEVMGVDLSVDVKNWQAELNTYVEANALTLYNITAKTKGEYSNIFVNGVSEATLGTGEEVPDGVEVVDETGVVEVAEELSQQVVAPKRAVAAKPAAAKPAAPVVPIRRVAAPVPAAPTARRVVSLRK